MRIILPLIGGIILIILSINIPVTYSKLFFCTFITALGSVCYSLYRFILWRNNYFYCYLFIPILIIFYLILIDNSERSFLHYYKGHFKVIATVKQKGSYKSDYMIHCYYYDGLNFRDSEINVDYPYYKNVKDIKLVILESDSSGYKIISSNPTAFEILKFLKPVYYRGKEEIGNDYYYYAKIQSDISLKNFGLRRVTKLIENSDTILYYKNLNDSIDSQTYRCVDSLQTQSNRDKVGDSFGFLFHDGIYSKEQVFEEIPHAKEYYLKYCKEEQKIINEN